MLYVKHSSILVSNRIDVISNVVKQGFIMNLVQDPIISDQFMDRLRKLYGACKIWILNNSNINKYHN